MKANVKRWYRRVAPHDGMGKRINESTTFADVLLGIAQGAEVYDIIGVSDSLIRERIFAEIAERMGCEYDVVYNIWLNS